MRVRQGIGSKLDELSKAFESRHVDGWLSTDIYRSESDLREYWIAVVFRDEASYRRNADDPTQDQWFNELRKLLESDPEWHDGEVVHSAHTH